jgi:transcriptional regulator with XRE-family HTH domain
MATTTFLQMKDRIRKARLAAGLSQERFAEVVGTSRRHVMKWEKGTHRPTPRYLARIAEATGMETDFFEGDDDAEGPEFAGRADTRDRAPCRRSRRGALRRRAGRGMKYRYRCPYCRRAFKHAGSVARHRAKGSQPGWCVVDPAAALAMNRERRS